jgi:hypothetical protein
MNTLRLTHIGSRTFATTSLFLALSCAPFGVNAALSSRDLIAGSGDNLLTFDDSTHLEWLDVTQTRGLSFNYVSGQLDAGGRFAGFQIASSAMVQQLMIDGGWSGSWNTGYTGSAAHYAEVMSIVGFLGNTAVNIPDLFVTYGFVSDAGNAGEHYHDGPYAYAPSVFSGVYSGVFSTAADVTSDGIGTFLYRPTAPIPEPETYAMMLAGLGLLGSLVRRRPRTET